MEGRDEGGGRKGGLAGWKEGNIERKETVKIGKEGGRERTDGRMREKGRRKSNKGKNKCIDE